MVSSHRLVYCDGATVDASVFIAVDREMDSLQVLDGGRQDPTDTSVIVYLAHILRKIILS